MFLTPAEIAATRHLIGLTQAELATALNVNRHTIKDWESGRHEPRPGVVAEIQALRREHDQQVDILAATAADGDVIALPAGPKPPGWYLALGARVRDRCDTARLQWHG